MNDESTGTDRSRHVGPDGRGWVPMNELVAARHGPQTKSDPWRSWRVALPLWWMALRAGGAAFCREAERQRRRVFVQPVRLSQFLAIEYVTPPVALNDELAKLRELGVRDVVLPLDQDASETQQEQSLAAINKLKAEGCRVSATLRQSARATADHSSWTHFCHLILAQVGWQLQCVRLGDRLDEHVANGPSIRAFQRIFSILPELRHAFPGVAMASPGVVSLENPSVFRCLRGLEPEGGGWDCLSLQAPPWAVPAREAEDAAFMLRLTMAGALAAQGDRFGRRVRVFLPPLPLEAGEEADERLLAILVRRVLLAMASGVVEKVTLGWDSRRDDALQRKAVIAVTELLAQFDGARFVRQLPVGTTQGPTVMEFTDRNRAPLFTGWTVRGVTVLHAPFHVRAARDFLGRSVPLLPYPRLRVSAQPAFFAGEVGGSSEGRS